MENILLIIFFLSGSLIFGSLMGLLMFKIKKSRLEKNLLKEARDFLNGERENVINIDGKKIGAYSFRLKDEDGKEITLNVKGGINNEKESCEEESQIIEDYSSIRENSRSIRKKQRTPRKKKRTFRERRKFF